MTPNRGSLKTGQGERGGIAGPLLAWYDAHHRDLPWRVAPAALAAGTRPDPYRVWLSEIMLQQTTVEAVKPYFRAFTGRWPDVSALAAADTEDVMKAWAGLGYYSRARNLKKCAELVASLAGSRFPDSEEGLRALPGVGAYTAAAIAAVAFDRPAPVVDGNVERVMSRLFVIEAPNPRLKEEVRALLADGLVPAERPGDFAQAMMDLGATICTPKRPRCMLCPLREDCGALADGDPERLPIKAKKADKPVRRGAAFVAMRADGAILMRKRPESGLLGGMTEVPTTAWTSRQDGDVTVSSAPFPAGWRAAGTVVHVFTHFELRLDIFRADIGMAAAPAGHFWSARADVGGEALPTVMKKAIEAAAPGLLRPGG
ncbi:MAG: A/G-specific adenine glycosylase [Rhizobiaceae bacterium]